MERGSSLLLPGAIVVAIFLVAIGIGVGIGYGVLQPPKSRAEARVIALQNRIDDLEDQRTSVENTSQGQALRIDDLLGELVLAAAERKSQGDALVEARAATQAVHQDLKESRESVADRVAELARLEGQLVTLSGFKRQIEGLENALLPLENDRLLLVELRKDPPDAKEAADEYWKNLKRLAVQSDTSLGPKVDRVIRLLPTFFDWQESATEGEFSTGCDSINAYITTGAIDYSTVTGDLEKDVFLVLINRLDSVVALLN